jgi:hypothetical protein
MKTTFAVVLILAVVLVLAFGVVGQAWAGTTEDIIADAGDGTLDGDWTPEQIQGAIDWLADNPTATQYSGVQGVLEDYLASLQAPGSESGELAFTGSEMLLVLGAGAGLVATGALLRRRRA